MASSKNPVKPSIRSNPIAVFVAALFLAVAAATMGAPSSAFAKRAKVGKHAKGKHAKGKNAKGKHAKAGKNPGKKRVALVPPSDAGAAAQPLVGKMAAALKAHQIQAVSGAAVKKAVAKDSPSMDGDWMRVAAKLKVDAVIESTMSETGTTNRLEIVVHNGADGGIAARETFLAKGPPKKLVAVVGSGFWKKLGPAIQGTSPPEKGGSALPVRDLSGGDLGLTSSRTTTSEEKSEKVAIGDDDKRSAGGEKVVAGEDKPEDADTSEDEDEENGGKESTSRRGDSTEDDEDEGPNAGTGPRAVEVELDLRMLRRVYQYSPPSAAPSYQLKFVPLVGGQATWHFIKYLGIFVRGEFTAALKSGIYPSATREIVAGAQGRYPFSTGQVHVNVAFFQHLFHILDTESTTDAARSSLLTPNVTYSGVRLGAGGRLYLGNRILIGAEGAYRLVTEAGSPAVGPDQVRSPNYFPNGKVSVALDAGAFFGFKVLDFVEARVSTDYRRYVFGPLTGPRLNVAGAADDYLAVNLGVVGVFGGK
jgi:hypothetical protein